jgi:predicted  nucleic acid-binding Zn-ribbon protein
MSPHGLRSLWFSISIARNQPSQTVLNMPFKESGQKCNGYNSRMCSKCGASADSSTECYQAGCSECGSTAYKSPMSFACPEHKCTNCEGTLEPKGHNRNDCPRMQGCSECGSKTHKSAVSFACPEHSEAIAKARWNRRATSETTAPECKRRMRRNRPQREQMPHPSVLCICLRSHKLQTSHLCAEHVCTLCYGEEEPKCHNNTYMPSC